MGYIKSENTHSLFFFLFLFCIFLYNIIPNSHLQTTSTVLHQHSNLQESHIIGTSLDADNIFFESSNSKATNNFAMSMPEGMVNVADESTPQIPITEKVEDYDSQPLPLSLPSVYYWWRCHMCSRTYMDAGHACSCGHIKCRLCRWGYS
jgi:hypothetical protein